LVIPYLSLSYAPLPAIPYPALSANLGGSKITVTRRLPQRGHIMRSPAIFFHAG
jgi:hypothetical protein